jgi:hypothetical protein
MTIRMDRCRRPGRSVPVAVLGIALALAACGGSTTTPTQQHQWTAAVTGIGAHAQLTGQGAVAWIPGSTQFVATMQIMNDVQGQVRPWHVHFGTCATGGGIVGADGDYPRLTITGAGSATATATVPMSLDINAPYHINVHLSEAEMATIIACGDLVLN